LIIANHRKGDDSGSDGQLGDVTDAPLPGLFTKGFQLPFLSTVFWAQRATAMPATNVFTFCSIEYSRVHVLHEVQMVDTSGFDGGAQSNDQNDGVNRQADTCLLQLINILMGDVYYERLISELRANPRLAEIDQKKDRSRLTVLG
jgi:hypothetical protein